MSHLNNNNTQAKIFTEDGKTYANLGPDAMEGEKIMANSLEIEPSSINGIIVGNTMPRTRLVRQFTRASTGRANGEVRSRTTSPRLSQA